ncbi:hypothetical protein BXZ70DRAFT_888986, partial [Cristinia sonorae]
YAKAASAELHRDYDVAFRLYVETVQNYLYMAQKSAVPSVRATCKAQAGKALERAEKIKSYKMDLNPVSINHFSEQSQYAVLKKSSYVNKIHVPLNNEVSSLPSFIQPPLSTEQISQGAMWKTWSSSETSALEELAPEDIVQHIVSDCSVCASISVCIDHNRRFQSKVLSIILTLPVDDAPHSGDPVRYRWDMIFNGGPRIVQIDNQLPCYPDGELMCVSTRNKQHVLPSLMEKAYMALMGGYDFPGSSVLSYLPDAMTGWIPEMLEIRSPAFERERTWQRIVDGYTLGMCVLTLGTGEALSSAAELSSMYLKPAHCYAVVGVSDSESDRRVTVLDSEYHAEEEAHEQEEGSHLLTWDTVCHAFDGIYLSWNPSMFKHSLTFHGRSWRKSPSNIEQPNHFQLSLKVQSTKPAEEDVWILLTRHVVDTTRTSEFIALSAQTAQASDVNEMYMKGTYTNSTHVLVTTNPDLALVCSYDGEYDDVGFTVTVYSSIPASWVEDSVKLPYSTPPKITGAFTNKTAGGNPSHSSYMANPQYRLRIEQDKASIRGSSREKRPRVQLKLQSDRRIPLNISVVWSQGQRIADLVQNEIVATSGAYTYGFASVLKDMPVGEYTVVVSAFEPKYTGPFTLLAESTHKIELSPIPQEGAGMFSKPLTGAWSDDSAAGGPSFKRYTSNPCYELKVTTSTEVKIRLQVTSSTRSVSINVTLFQLSDNKLGQHLATSGPYSDAHSGVITPQLKLGPGKYAIVPSTYSPGMQATFKLILYSTDSGTSLTPLRLASASS